MSEATLTHERLTEVMDYDVQTGAFTRRITTGKKAPAGSRADRGGPGGRLVVTIDKYTYYAMRLAWFYINREWPTGKVVPIDGNLQNIRFANLADKAQSEISAASKVNTLNTSGIKGVSWNKAKAKWIAMITRDGSQHYLGSFASKEEAAAAYQNAAETGTLPGPGSKKDPNWATSRRQRSAQWKDITLNPAIVGWETLEQFVADIGAPPTTDHVLMRERYDEPLGPGNVRWRLPWSKRPGHDDDPQRSYNLGLGQHQYEITPEEYARLYEKQGGLCAACKRPEKTPYRGVIRRLAVDHSHATGEIRGLLCANCNNGIGRFQDDPALLRAAAEYLEDWSRRAAGRINPSDGEIR